MTDPNAPLANSSGEVVTNGEHKRIVFQATAKVIAPIAAIILLAVAIGGALVYHELSERTEENLELIQRLTHLERAEAKEEEAERKERMLVRARIKRTDVLHCREIEALKAAERRAARENFAMLDRNAELLGITITPQLRSAAREGVERTLKRFRARPGGCGNLPSLRPT